MLKLLEKLFFRKKPQIRRRRIYWLLRSLNLHIKKIVAENPAPKSKEVIKTVNELYQLKEDVILKLLSEGHIRVRGEVPNKPRMSLWRKMLAIISKLEADNVLPRAKTVKWRHNDLVFKCKVYEHKGFQIVIPQQPPKKKTPFRKGWYNPLMEQQFPSHMSEKRSSTMLRQYYGNQFT